MIALTGLFEIDQVFISINGVPQPMLTERGTADAAVPLTRAEYASLAPNVGPIVTPDAEPSPADGDD